MSNNGKSGGRDWIRTALDRYEGQLVRYAQRLTGDAERARDVVQEIFLKLCRQNQSELDGHLAEWLFAVCRNHAIDVRRKESRMTTLAEPQTIETPSPEPTPAALVERGDSAGRILELVDRLPSNQQEVIRLRFQNSLSYREIAAVTGLTVTNVGFLIHRGLKTVREKTKVVD